MSYFDHYWICPNCDSVAEYHKGTWTCPTCGCSTEYPDEDALVPSDDRFVLYANTHMDEPSVYCFVNEAEVKHFMDKINDEWEMATEIPAVMAELLIENSNLPQFDW